MLIHCLWALAKTHASFLWVQVSEHYNLCTKGTLFKSTGAAAWNPGKDVPNELIPDVTLCWGREETAGSHWDFHQVNLKLLAQYLESWDASKCTNAQEIRTIERVSNLSMGEKFFWRIKVSCFVWKADSLKMRISPSKTKQELQSGILNTPTA